jgi:hypothetical protein
MAYLGEMDEAGRVGVERRAEQRDRSWQPALFESEVEPEWVEVDLKGVRVERSRAFGGPWLGLELCRRLGRIEFLEQVIVLLR